MVCLDTGHHAPGTNIEFIVAQLLRLGKLGSFDFNSRFYADDDLIVGAADPFQLFRILVEVIRGGGYGTTPTSRSCSTSATTSRPRSRPDPLGAQRAGDDGTGTAPRPDGARRRPDRRATCCARTRSSWTPSTPTCARSSPTGASRAGYRATRWRRSPQAITHGKIARSARAARRPDGARSCRCFALGMPNAEYRLQKCPNHAFARSAFGIRVHRQRPGCTRRIGTSSIGPSRPDSSSGQPEASNG